MYKFIPAILFFVMVSYGAALGENFEVKDFRYTPQVENSETAVLIDETGNEWLVGKGDRVYEWTVTDITSEYVELTQYQNEGGGTP